MECIEKDWNRWNGDITEVETIDLGKLLAIDDSPDDAEIIELNKRVEISHPTEPFPMLMDDGEFHWLEPVSLLYRQPSYRTISGQIVKPTQITSLLGQNPCESKDFKNGWHYDTDGSKQYSPVRRPINFDPCNPDDKKLGRDWLEDWYEQRDKSSKWEQIGIIDPDCYKVVESIDPMRLEFICPEHETDLRCLENPWLQYNITVYINPANGGAVWYCPQCNTGRDKREHQHPTTHPIDRELYDKLAEAGILPEHKYQTNDSRVPDVVAYVRGHQGYTMNQIDIALGYHVGTTKRVIDMAGADSGLKVIKRDGKSRVHYDGD